MKKKLPKFSYGGFLDFLKTNQSAIEGFASLGGGAIDVLDSIDGNQSTGGSLASGALNGISAGAAFGPIGMGIGAVLGGATSLFMKNAREKEEEKAKRETEERRRLAELNMRKAAQAAMNRNFSTTGMDVPGFYALGGSVIPSYIAEGEEVIQHSSDIPFTFNGSLDRLSSDTSVIHGPRHNSKAGGVEMTGGDRIYSDRMEVSKKIARYFRKGI